MGKVIFWVVVGLAFLAVIMWILRVRLPSKNILQRPTSVNLQTSLAINFDATGSNGAYMFETTDAFKRRYEAVMLKTFPNREITQLTIRFVDNTEQAYGDYWEGNKLFAGFTPKISESAVVAEIYLSPDLKKRGWNDQMILDHALFTVDKSILMAKYLHSGFHGAYTGIDSDAKNLRTEFPDRPFNLKNNP